MRYPIELKKILKLEKIMTRECEPALHALRHKSPSEGDPTREHGKTKSSSYLDHYIDSVWMRKRITKK